MEATRTSAHANVRRDGSKSLAVEEQAKTLNNVSVRMHQADEQRSSVADTDLVDLLGNLNIIRGECADEAAIEAPQFWATREDQENFVQA